MTAIRIATTYTAAELNAGIAIPDFTSLSVEIDGGEIAVRLRL